MANIQGILLNMAVNQQLASNTIVTGFRNLSLDTSKQEIPVFSGEIGSQTVQDWFDKADRIAQINGWTPEEKLRIYQERLVNTASCFNDTLPAVQKDTFDYWRLNFSAGFNDEVIKTIFLNNSTTRSRKTLSKCVILSLA